MNTNQMRIRLIALAIFWLQFLTLNKAIAFKSLNNRSFMKSQLCCTTQILGSAQSSVKLII